MRNYCPDLDQNEINKTEKTEERQTHKDKKCIIHSLLRMVFIDFGFLLSLVSNASNGIVSLRKACMSMSLYQWMLVCCATMKVHVRKYYYYYATFAIHGYRPQSGQLMKLQQQQQKYIYFMFFFLDYKLMLFLFRFFLVLLKWRKKIHTIIFDIFFSELKSFYDRPPWSVDCLPQSDVQLIFYGGNFTIHYCYKS